MAPILGRFDAFDEQHQLLKRLPATVSTSFIPLIITATLLSLLTFILFVWTIRHLWSCLIHPRFTSHEKSEHVVEASHTTDSKPPKADIRSRQNSYWARKDSNVLWSSYIEDDDLLKQFSAYLHKENMSSKNSRMFSIGSVSTLDGEADQGKCPLDTSPTKPKHARTRSAITGRKSRLDSIVCAEDDMNENGPGNKQQICQDGVRTRNTYEQEKTPTKTLQKGRLRAFSTSAANPEKTDDNCTAFEAAEKKLRELSRCTVVEAAS